MRHQQPPSRRTVHLRRRCRPSLEAMEARQLLSTITVVNTADSGTGSLRQAILDAKANDTIAFDIPGVGHSGD